MPDNTEQSRLEQEIAVARAETLGVVTALTPAQLVAGCRALHACEGTGDADALMHTASQKSWEEPTVPRWSQWVETVSEVAAAILALPAGAGERVPVGWKLVSVEPTPEMVEAENDPSEVYNASGDWADDLSRAHAVYRAMLAAAPPEPVKAAGEAEHCAENANCSALAGWQTIDRAPYACHVLASRFDDFEWVCGVVMSPPSYPFTHWMHLPPMPDEAPPAPVQAAKQGVVITEEMVERAALALQQVRLTRLRKLWKTKGESILADEPSGMRDDARAALTAALGEKAKG